jgi:sugar phosphate isomerase/epimerase
MVKPYLAMVGLKDYKPHLHTGEVDGSLTWECVLAGQGGVQWRAVFAELAKMNFQGPCSVHAEFEPPRHAPHLFLEMARADIIYFKQLRDEAVHARETVGAAGSSAPRVGA